MFPQFLLLLILALPQAATTQEEPFIAFDHYHALAEIEAYLGAVAARYPQLVTLNEIGRSLVGRPIWAVDVNNPATGPVSEKPGFYVDGNIHGGEVLAGEGALAFLERILSGYGTDPESTELVDGRAFYVVPIVNPDGRAISLDTPENHRWNIRPFDEDSDGRMDEDRVGGVDLNRNFPANWSPT
ncbi:MAG: M14 family zinc carboxypeptidase, partial [Gemmatimonadota bacterium]